MASKSTDIRPKITLACTECKERNYITRKNRRNDPDRMELKKYCPRCRMPPAAPRDALTFAPPASATLRRPLRRPASAPQVRVVSLVASPPCLRMPLDPGLAGRTFDPTPPYTVSREKIAEFTRAIGADPPSTTGRRRR